MFSRYFKNFVRYFADDNNWLVAKNLKDQNPKWFKKSFPSLIILKYIF